MKKFPAFTFFFFFFNSIFTYNSSTTTTTTALLIDINKWETRNTFLDHVSLAKKRGLSCGLSQSLNNKNYDNDTISISGTWKNQNKCRIQISKFINGKNYFVMLDRNSIGTELIFSIDQKDFYLGKSINLQVDNFKELTDSPITRSKWEAGNDIISTTDISHNTSFIIELKKGNYLVVENDNYFLHISLMGFSNAYNRLSPTYECG